MRPRLTYLFCLGIFCRFDQDFFHFSTKQTEKMDIVVRLLMEVTHEAIMDARLPVDALNGSRTGKAIS